MLLKGLGTCMRNYPLLTAIGCYSGLFLVGQQIALKLYGRHPRHYAFGDATLLTLKSASRALAAFIGRKTLDDYEFGDLTAASLERLETAFKQARGQETRKEVGLEAMVVSFFEQAACLLQRCLDRGFLTLEEAEAGADGEDDLGARVRVAVAAAVLLSAACRSVDDDVAREADSFVLASGAGVVTKRSVPPVLQESLALTIEAKTLLRRSRPDAEARARLCEAVVRAGATGAADGDALTASLLKAAAAFRTRLRAVFESNMDDVFVAVVEDRFGAFDDQDRLTDHLLPHLGAYERDARGG